MTNRPLLGLTNNKNIAINSILMNKSKQFQIDYL